VWDRLRPAMSENYLNGVASMSSSTLSLMQKVELLKQIANNPNIPSPPTVILKVLEKASQPDCTIGDLCQIIQMDPGLSANILRVVNSATFGLSRAVTSIQRALAVVGLKSARLLILAISFPKMQKTQKLYQSQKQRYWKSSIAGAIVAKELSKRMPNLDAEDNMAAGLLRDMGELILHQIFPDAYHQVLQTPAELLVNGQCELEEQLCGLNHAEVSAFLLDRWRMPTDITEAIRHHHDPEAGTYSSPKAKDRAVLLQFATRAAQLLAHPDQPLILKELLEVAKTHFQMSDAEVNEFLIPLSRKTTDFAALLQVDIGDNNDYQKILARAGEELVNLTMSANLDNQRAQEQSRQAESEARRWKHEAVFDPLTKVFNRRFLETRLRELFDRPPHKERAFGLLFIDLDGFKLLNDRNGHLFGDYVLQQVADCLNRLVRQGDIVARYGGDEFCILAEPMDEVGSQALSRRAWEQINALTIRQGDLEGKVGASIGAVYCNEQTKWHSPDELLSATDKAMYHAKTLGKNRVVFLGTIKDADPKSVELIVKQAGAAQSFA
jgi:diguanylate cyclase (GGDEF)-like protein